MGKEKGKEGETHTHAQIQAQTQTAELIREVGLKCMSFNGVPRTINCLNTFYASLPRPVTDSLATSPSRAPSADNIAQVLQRGRQLFDSIYSPVHDRLYNKLARAHPDLPIVILSCHYGMALADPPPSADVAADAGDSGGLARLGRMLTSLVAVSCLRAQTGVGLQLHSHMLGLQKGVADGTYRADEPAESTSAAEWLASDDGGEWILRTVDDITRALGESNFGDASRVDHRL